MCTSHTLVAVSQVYHELVETGTVFCGLVGLLQVALMPSPAAVK